MPVKGFEELQRLILRLPGVTYVGGRGQPLVGVQTEEVRARLRPHFRPGIAVVVMPVQVTVLSSTRTGPAPADPKHPCVATYERVMRETKPC